jgi:hypothetical protein
MIATRQGDTGAARVLYHEALGLAWHIGDRRRVAFCLEGLSAAAVKIDPERAVC